MLTVSNIKLKSALVEFLIAAGEGKMNMQKCKSQCANLKMCQFENDGNKGKANMQ
jgi:hypothetical protein